MDSRSTSGRPFYLWWFLPLAILVLGLTLTALFTPATQTPVIALAQELSRSHNDKLNRALITQGKEVIAAAQGLDLTDSTVDTFRTDVAAFLSQFPEIAGVELLTTISHAERTRAERRLSAQAGRSVRFSSWTGPRKSQTAEPADHYLVISQGLFQDDNPGVPGLGLIATSVPHWRHVLQQAIQEGRPTATPLTGLEQNGSLPRTLRVFVPLSAPGQLAEDTAFLALVILPDSWLRHRLSGLHDERWQVEIHDISQHAHRPLATLPAAQPLATDFPPIRSVITLANREWMVSTYPAAGWLDELRQQARLPLWLTGLLITLLSTGLCGWACHRLIARERHLLHRNRRSRRLKQQLDNTGIEKNILYHSLQQGDRRTQDLIELNSGIFAELDEQRRIGYLSPQAAVLLGIPTTELTDSPLDTLFAADMHQELAMLFDAARQGQSVERLDTEVVTRDGPPLPVTLRAKAIRDPLSGWSGFRVSLTPR